MARWLGSVLLGLLAGCALAQPLPPPVDPWPIDGAVMRPEAMFVEPVRARSGDMVAVTYPVGWDRGILYAIDADVGGEWDRRHLLISDANGGRPMWFTLGDADVAVEAVGIGGPGPDRVPIPEGIEPGAYRICTANAGENICTPIEVVVP